MSTREPEQQSQRGGERAQRTGPIASWEVLVLLGRHDHRQHAGGSHRAAKSAVLSVSVSVSVSVC